MNFKISLIRSKVFNLPKENQEFKLVIKRHKVKIDLRFKLNIPLYKDKLHNQLREAIE